MTSINGKNIQLPWNQHDKYWISVYAKTGSFTPKISLLLQEAGFQPSADNGMSVCTGKDWKTRWELLYSALKQSDALDAVDIAFAPDANSPAKRTEVECKTPSAIQLTAENMWLGDAVREDRLMCYLQPVMSANDKIFGYESFARVRDADGKIIGGDKIIAASKALGIDYTIDRFLHIEAIKTFAGSDFSGFLFVNFFPGFIHRPSVYLEGLTETAKNFGIVSKNIVLDFTNSETPHDILHLKNVCDYARARGYSIALDDIASVDNAKKLVPEIRPDFIKIDMHLVQQVTEPNNREIIRALVEMAHKTASTVIAEGVETDESVPILKSLGGDLFQGYLFSAPVPVEAALARATGIAAS